MVGGGDVVQGGSYSSVSVQTYTNDGEGTSTVRIETDTNGKKSEQTITKTIAPGESSDIHIATSTGDSRVEVRSHIGGGDGGSLASTSASTSVAVSAKAADFGAYFQAFLSSVLHFWHFW